MIWIGNFTLFLTLLYGSCFSFFDVCLSPQSWTIHHPFRCLYTLKRSRSYKWVPCPIDLYVDLRLILHWLLIRDHVSDVISKLRFQFLECDPKLGFQSLTSYLGISSFMGSLRGSFCNETSYRIIEGNIVLVM